MTFPNHTPTAKNLSEEKKSSDTILSASNNRQNFGVSTPAEIVPGLICSFNSSNSLIRKGPVLGEEAFYGLAGEYARINAPYSEADPVGVLVQFCGLFGNAIGRSAHFYLGNDRHSAVLYTALIGKTSIGKKGTAYSDAKRPFLVADPEWAKMNIKTGLSSGEGLIHQVRDPGKTSQGEDDPGVTDKRILVYQSEFSSVLRNIDRTGNTLSETMRDAWDGLTLQTMTKNSPEMATNYHISVIGHITPKALKKRLNFDEKENGFGNRFFWIYVESPKDIPDAERAPDELIQPIIDKLKTAIQYGKEAGEIELDEEAKKFWRVIYPTLRADEDEDGCAELKNRAKPQIRRLAAVYALLDLSNIVRLEHLRAAYAIWRYSEASLGFVFGGPSGCLMTDPYAVKIYEALNKAQDGLTRTQISRDVLRGNGAKEEITAALYFLETKKLSYVEKKNMTNGKSCEIWRNIR